MVVLGALINGLEASAGGVLGLVLKRRMRQDLGDFLLKAMGLCVVMIAVQGFAGGGSAIDVTLALALGGVLGFWLDIDGHVRRMGDKIQARLDARSSGDGPSPLGDFSQGFVSASLFICTGAMAIVGSLQAGMLGDMATLVTKGLIDLVVCVVMAASMGVGVPFAGVCVFVYEAALSLLASFLAPILSDLVIEEMTAAGSLLLLTVGLNMMGVTDIKVANLLPAAFLPIVLVPMLAALGVAL